MPFFKPKSSTKPLDQRIKAAMFEDNPQGEALLAQMQDEILKEADEVLSFEGYEGADISMAAAARKDAFVVVVDYLLVVSKYGVQRFHASEVQMNAHDDKLQTRTLVAMFPVSKKPGDYGAATVELATSEGFKMALKTYATWHSLFQSNSPKTF